MRAAVLGRTYLLRTNRGKWCHVPDGITLTVITPPRVRHVLSEYAVQPSRRWPHIVVPGWMTDRMSAFCYAPVPLWSALSAACPDLIQVDEEPSSLALLQALLMARRLRCRTVFFTWENITFAHSPLSRLLVQVAIRLADGVMAGNSEALCLLRRTGFQRLAAVIPQIGIDEEVFQPQLERQTSLRRALGLTRFTVGYFGRLVSEKGLLILLQALTDWQADWQWLIVGRGPLSAQLADQAQANGVSERIRRIDTVPHQEVARYLNALDALVLPSLSTPRWKEQFGHILIEAMACGVPVIGSDSGAIPEVIGDAGLIFPEGNVGALRERLEALQQDRNLNAKLRQQGRERVLERFTNRHIARQTAEFWQEVIRCG